MSSESRLDAQTVEHQLHIEINNALTKGALYSTLLGWICTVILLVLIGANAAKNLGGPCVFAFLAGTYSFAVYGLARKGKMSRRVIYVTFVPFVSLPTIFFVLTHFMMPAGAATFITGPISYLYFHLIIMTGFIFDPKLSIMAGIVAAAGYQACYFLARDQLMTIRAPDPTLLQDLTSLPIFANKTIMMLFGGLVVAALSYIAKRLVFRSLQEARSKDRISRLFGQYVSDEVKERIINEKFESVGERRNVVVLFSDLRGFSTFSEGRQPEEIVAHLNEYFDTMVGSITAAGGVVDKFMGDAIMAVFGGVMDLENPAESAFRAALGMRTSLERLNRRWKERGLEPFDNGVGMHLGEVLQGPIGSRDRKEFTVIGDAVNTASRLEALTKQYAQKIIVTESFVRALPELLKARAVALGNVTVKGKREEVAIYGIGDEPDEGRPELPGSS